ncbi:MAG TPA: YdeI/OmpD-associated family protein [Solirubrobacteraceae bacterium]
MVHKGLPVLEFARLKDWESWLTDNHNSPGLWLKIAKKGSGITSVTYEQALEGALCFGWIDGQKASLDERHWLQRFTPRSPKSKWSQINRSKAEDLIAQGRMTPAGLEHVQKARQDGRWEAAYEGQSTATVPDDLACELARNPRASEFFKTLDSANRYAILYRIADAKLPATRARRIAKFIAMLEAGEKIHP